MCARFAACASIGGIMTHLGSSLLVYASGSVITSAGQSLTSFLSQLAVQVPEPGMMLLFGLGAGVLGLRMGRNRKH